MSDDLTAGMFVSDETKRTLLAVAIIFFTVIFCHLPESRLSSATLVCCDRKCKLSFYWEL